MVFAILTLLAALGLATVAGWFSIIGMMAIFASAPLHALILGVVIELGKLVTTSWVYRNWEHSNWQLKVPLIAATCIVMLVTSIGVFGFLSKAHLEQGASTVDNSARVERLDQQIAREKSVIADNEKVISQLDATINSYLGKDRADRSVTIRKSQAPQRKQLRDDIDVAQKKVDALSEERFVLQSEVRKLELEVGPIRYISELMYGTEDATKNIESAVRMFTLLIVLTLDPLAIILLVAANHTLLRLQNEKKKKIAEGRQDIPEAQAVVSPDLTSNETDGNKAEVESPPAEVLVESVQVPNTDGDERASDEPIPNPVAPVQESEVHVSVLEEAVDILNKETESEPDIILNEQRVELPIIRNPQVTLVEDTSENNNNVDTTVEIDTHTKETGPWMSQSHILSELLGSSVDLSSKRIDEKEKTSIREEDSIAAAAPSSIEEIHSASENSVTPNRNGTESVIRRGTTAKKTETEKTAPLVLSWINEFKGQPNGQ